MTHFLPEVEYNGPAELAPLWDKFTRKYIAKEPYNLSNVNLLNQLVFGKIETFFSQHGKDYADTKRGIEACAHVMETMCLTEEDLRPLQQSIIERLVAQWIEMEKQCGLYPPPAMGNGRGEKAEKIRSEREAVLKSPQGALIADTLRMIFYHMIEAQKKRFPHVDPHIVLRAANKSFDYSLFNYELGHDTTFAGSVKRGLNRWMGSTIGKLLPKEILPDDKEDEYNDTHSLIKHVADTREPMPDGRWLEREEKSSLRQRNQRLHQAVEALSERESLILKLRFGLKGEEHSLKEVARIFGFSLERGRQIEQEGLEKLADTLPLPAREELEISDKPLTNRYTKSKRPVGNVRE